jgi:hypothetical protein
MTGARIVAAACIIFNGVLSDNASGNTKLRLSVQSLINALILM